MWYQFMPDQDALKMSGATSKLSACGDYNNDDDDDGDGDGGDDDDVVSRW